jgi:hypothetical protein
MVGKAIRISLLIAVMLSTSAYYNQGCSAPRSSSRTISRQEANDYLRKGEKADLRAFRGGVEIDPVSGVPVKSLDARISSLTYYAGHGGAFSLAAPDRAAAKLLARFLKGHYVGAGGATLFSADHGEFFASVRLNFSARGAGSACIAVRGTTSLGQQEGEGSFTVMGGTGAAARLHATGTFRAVDPDPRSSTYQAEFYANPSLGSKRPMPKGCGYPNLGAPTPGGKVTASFKGFVTSVGPPSPSATPTSSTISAGSCHSGGDLYGVFQYAGPAAARFNANALSSSGQGQTHTQNVKSGTNALLLYTAPTNGSYETKIYIESTGKGVLTGNTAFYPTVTVNC